MTKIVCKEEKKALFPSRCSGVLLPIFSLPSKEGVGCFGQDAYRFVDWLKSMSQSVWQILPLGPTIKVGNPYTAYSSFGGNPLFISLEGIKEMGLLDIVPEYDGELLDGQYINYDEVENYKFKHLHKAFKTFNDLRQEVALQKDNLTKSAYSDQIHHYDSEYLDFVGSNLYWLKDYALFSLMTEILGESWMSWPIEYQDREEETLNQFSTDNREHIRFVYFVQWLFHRQWHALKSYANQNSIRFLGDLPIFVDHHSVDVWCHRSIFKLDQHGRPISVSGAPPDQFSDLGQVWNTPVYRWDKLKETHYEYWMLKLKYLFSLFDITRIDHFRGLAAYWDIPNVPQGSAEFPDARQGSWAPAYGRELFETLKKNYSQLPLVVEDLGDIDQAVLDLRDDFGLIGMKILQFAFDSDDTNPYLPSQIPVNSMVYSGTHDNNTTLGWGKEALQSKQADIIKSNLQTHLHLSKNTKTLKAELNDLNWIFIKTAHASKAILSMIPLQDILGLDESARINIPGVAEDNWRWQCRWDQFSAANDQKFLEMTVQYQRNLR